jgi:site-specific DNA-methyltransferase (adenine-specific)
MLNDNRVRNVVDYVDSRECFPGVDIAGGVCYFLWDRDNRGDCTVTHYCHGTRDVSVRPLNEFHTFVRSSISVAVIKKIRSIHKGGFLVDIVASRNPFGLASRARPSKRGELILNWSGGKGPIPASQVRAGHDLVKQWKVLLSKASSDHGGQPDKRGMRRIFSRVEVLGPGEVCSESYLIVGSYSSRYEAENLATFLRTRFCRYLVSTILFTQNIAKDRFQFVPSMPMTRSWTDSALYKAFGLTVEEFGHIESTIRPMEASDESRAGPGGVSELPDSTGVR